MPVLMAKRAIADRRAGDLLKVVVTDPAAPKDFETFARLEGHHMSAEKQGDAWVILLTVYPFR